MVCLWIRSKQFHRLTPLARCPSVHRPRAFFGGDQCQKVWARFRSRSRRCCRSCDAAGRRRGLTKSPFACSSAILAPTTYGLKGRHGARSMGYCGAAMSSLSAASALPGARARSCASKTSPRCAAGGRRAPRPRRRCLRLRPSIVPSSRRRSPVWCSMRGRGGDAVKPRRGPRCDGSSETVPVL